MGFQVHFVEPAPDMMAIGGVLLGDSGAGALLDSGVFSAERAEAIRKKLL
ncbi:hypothetical protein [Nonomuraea sp. 10N515B]